MFVLFIANILPGLSANENNEPQKNLSSGKKSYDFYCYQCHGYAGNARTLASTYLSPPPRNFTDTSPEKLDRQAMLDAVTHGRDGTAMVSFSSVLSHEDIANVVSYIRESFMQNIRQPYIYHTKENGWPDHQRYNDAFPFASGKLPLDTPWEQLNDDQRNGKTLFMQSCISCHDRAVVNDEGPAWELRPLSYPRKHYNHKAPLDSISGASPYQVHEKIADTNGMSKQEQHGATLFQQNCAFCHGGDATGKNWIGSFMEPHARDLTSTEITQRQDQQLLHVIRNGLQNTSMPAWKHVLSDEQIIDVISYLKRQKKTDITTSTD
jgi:cytochrome c oxidase cbb3-type subunit 3